MTGSSHSPARFDEACVSDDDFRRAMRTAATGVTVVTTDGSAGRFGKTVSAMASVCVNPPSVLVCIYNDSPATQTITDNGVFCINLLGEAHQSVAEVFAGLRKAEDRFAMGDWTQLKTGAPALKDATAALDCRVAQSFEYGTHTIFIGSVLAVRVNGGEPLVYCDCAFRLTRPFAADASTHN